jgi:hydrogenase maturation protease
VNRAPGNGLDGPVDGRAVVIGVGHPYRGDDAVGLEVLRLLAGRGAGYLQLVESAGEPSELIEAWTGASVAIVVDAAYRPGSGQPGRIHVIDVDPSALGSPETETPPDAAGLAEAGQASSHGLGVGEAVNLARALHRLPGRLVIYAVEVAAVDFGEGMSEPVAKAAIEVADQIARSCR